MISSDHQTGGPSDTMISQKIHLTCPVELFENKFVVATNVN